MSARVCLQGLQRHHLMLLYTIHDNVRTIGGQGELEVNIRDIRNSHISDILCLRKQQRRRSIHLYTIHNNVCTIGGQSELEGSIRDIIN